MNRLTSSSIDIWVKNTFELVINDWYMMDDYHADHGEGCDDYSAGATRGDGGIGLWANNALVAPINFSASRTLANGPIRVLFELDYPASDAIYAWGKNYPSRCCCCFAARRRCRSPRVSLDAGSQFDHYVATFKGGSGPLTAAIGLKKPAARKLITMPPVAR